MARVTRSREGQRAGEPRHKERVQEAVKVRGITGRARDEIKKYIGKPELKDKKIGLL